MIALLILLAVPGVAHADLVVTEIMYDLQSGSDSGREWIEVLNTGEPIDLTTMKLRENNTLHGIIGSANVLPPHSFAIIADNPEKFKADWPAYQGLLFDSAFSLNNSGERIAITDKDGRELAAAEYRSSLGGNGTGDSLQRASANDAFAPGIPTPGSGIPPSGLQRSKPIEKQVAKSTPTFASGAIIGISESTPLPTTSPAPHSRFDWIAPFLIASCAVAALVVARQHRKDEWLIVDDPTESS